MKNQNSSQKIEPTSTEALGDRQDLIKTLMVAKKTKVELKSEVIKILYKNFPYNLLFIVFVVSIIYWVMPSVFNLESEFLATYLDEIWYNTMIAILALRAILFLWFRRTSNNLQLVRVHYFLFILGSTLTSFLWVWFLFLDSSDLVVYKVMSIFLIISMIGVGVHSLAASYMASVLCVVFSFVPLVLYLILKISKGFALQFNILMLLFLFVYAVYLIFSAKKLNKLIVGNIKIIFERQDLIDNFEYSKSIVEKIVGKILGGSWCVDENFKFIYVSKSLCDMLGYSPEEMLGRYVLEFMDNENRAILMSYIIDRYKTLSRKTREFELKLINKKGDPIWVNIVSSPEYDEKTKQVRFLGVIDNITEKKKILTEKNNLERKYQDLMDLLPTGVVVLSGDKIKFVNKAFMELLDADSASLLMERSIYDFIDPEFRSLKSHRLKELYKSHLKNTLVEEKFISLKGVVRYLKVLSSFVEFGGGPAALIIAYDITTEKSFKERVKFLESHDLLTGLDTRKVLESELRLSISSAKHDAKLGLVVLYINLDNFKNVNDTYGLNTGDLMIKTLSYKIKENLQFEDIMSRIEGDEFVIVLRQVSIQHENVVHIVSQLLKVTNAVYVIEGKTIQISASIGIAIFPRDGNNEYTLLDNAHIAMHGAKNKGGNTYQFYSHSIKEKILEKQEQESQLRDAIKRNEFYLVYQPKVSLKSGKIVGLEAMIRWNNPIQGVLMPALFIPLAEKIGLINKITQIVIEECCRQIVFRKENNMPIFKVAINISFFDFKDIAFLDKFNEILKKYDLNSNLFEFEITETSFFKNIENNLSFVNLCKNQGVKIAIDDFGTGYSSLSYLQYLKADSIKIDQSFIKNLPKDKEAFLMVEAITSMAHHLKIKVIVEGVETKEQLDLLYKCGCDEIQGFYITPPLKSGDLEKFYENYKGL